MRPQVAFFYLTSAALLSWAACAQAQDWGDPNAGFRERMLERSRKKSPPPKKDPTFFEPPTAKKHLDWAMRYAKKKFGPSELIVIEGLVGPDGTAHCHKNDFGGWRYTFYVRSQKRFRSVSACSWEPERRGYGVQFRGKETEPPDMPEDWDTRLDAIPGRYIDSKEALGMLEPAVFSAFPEVSARLLRFRKDDFMIWQVGTATDTWHYVNARTRKYYGSNCAYRALPGGGVSYGEECADLGKWDHP